MYAIHPLILVFGIHQHFLPRKLPYSINTNLLATQVCPWEAFPLTISRAGAFVPAAGEAAGPPMQSRKSIAPRNCNTSPGGQAASPAPQCNHVKVSPLEIATRPLEGRQPRRPRVPMLKMQTGGSRAFTPAAGEAAGPPMQSRKSIAPRNCNTPLEGRRPRRPRVQMLKMQTGGSRTFTPAAGEAAGPPMQSRKSIAPRNCNTSPGGPAASPAAGTNVENANRRIENFHTCGWRGRRPSINDTRN